MEGVPSDPSLRGVMPNAFNYVFDSVNAAPESVEFLVRASFLEIYMDEIYDLLNRAEGRKKLDLRMDKERGVFVKDLTMDTVKSPDDLFSLLHEGQKQRRVGATAMNPGSSRSHSIFTIVIESSTADEKSGVRTYKQGKLNLVDLAGSERLKKTGAEGERMEEAKYINLSLSTLGNVIKALASPTPQHVPFRDSKLTRLLEDSLGGNTKTCMIANIGPANHNYTETMSTLRYADRAKSIKNKPKVRVYIRIHTPAHIYTYIYIYPSSPYLFICFYCGMFSLNFATGYFFLLTWALISIYFFHFRTCVSVLFH